MTKTYSKRMGRLGHLVKNPEAAKPGELDRVADAFLARGKRKTGNEWLSTGQIQRRQKRELPLGHHAERVCQESNSWIGTLSKLRKPHRNK